MKYLFYCRRTLTSMLGIVCLTFLGYYHNQEVAMAIATVTVGLAGANAYQRAYESRQGSKDANVQVNSEPVRYGRNV